MKMQYDDDPLKSFSFRIYLEKRMQVDELITEVDVSPHLRQLVVGTWFLQRDLLLYVSAGIVLFSQSPRCPQSEDYCSRRVHPSKGLWNELRLRLKWIWCSLEAIDSNRNSLVERVVRLQKAPPWTSSWKNTLFSIRFFFKLTIIETKRFKNDHLLEEFPFQLIIPTTYLILWY